MYKVDKLKCFLDCDLCNSLLVDPIVIPCGNLICKAHLDKLINTSDEKSSFICGTCKEEHALPKDGFMVNHRLQSLLELGIDAFKASPIFDECKKEIEDARKNMREVELLETNSESYIYGYFEEIKRKIDLRREDIKLKIDEYSDGIIKSVEINQMNYIKLSKETNEISVNIEKSKKELSKLMPQFDSLEFNDKKFEDIKKSVAVVNQEFHKIIAEYKDSLIANKEYTFEFKELPMKDVFGRVTDIQVNF